jgi:hypothetical protein
MRYKISMLCGVVFLVAAALYILQMVSNKGKTHSNGVSGVTYSNDQEEGVRKPLKEGQELAVFTNEIDPPDVSEGKRVAATVEEAIEFCGERFFANIHRDNVTCPIADELAALLNDWDVLPYAPPAKKSCEEIRIGDNSRGLACEWGPPLDPHDGFSDSDLADLALNQGDALAAAKLAYRPMPAEGAYIWLLTAAALSESNRAAGALLRAAQGFDLRVSLINGKSVPDFTGLVRRISLEQIAHGRGHPAATPDHWLTQLEKAVGDEEVNQYLNQIEVYKSKVELALELIRSGAPKSEVEEVLEL